MKKYLQYWPIIAAVLISCGPNAKLRRAERLIARAELQGAVWSSDTVFKTIEVVTLKTQFDTVLKQVDFHDTITVEKDKVITRLKINTVTKEIFVSTECPPDTVEVLVPTIVNREIKAKGKGWTFYAAWVLILLIIGFIAGWIVKSKKGDISIRFDKPPEQ